MAGKATWCALKLPVAPPNLPVKGTCAKRSNWRFKRSANTLISLPKRVGDAG